MKRIGYILLMLFISTAVLASRIPEIEQYYIDKVSSLLKTRFPDTPFTVFVQVDVGDKDRKDDTRKKEIRRGEQGMVQLPYLEVEDDDVTVWSRVDVPLGTLIGLLEKVVVRVQIDSSVSVEELKELQENVAKQLKLDPSADSIEIARVNFNEKDKQKQKIWMLVGMVLVFAALFGIFWYLAKHSVTELVKGLSQPISEIGKTTQEFANSAMNLANDLTQGPSVADKSVNSVQEDESLSLGSNLIQIRKSALELLKRNQDMFRNPDSRFISFLEQQGAENPTQMGAILAELDKDSIKMLYKYGWGDWWFTALASPAPLTPTSIRILSEIDRMRVRWHFSEDSENKNNKNLEAGLVFGRLSEDQLFSILKDVQIQEAEPILDLLPRSQALSVAKKLYPGQWAKLLENFKSLSVINGELIEGLIKKAIQLKPLRKEDQIQEFFADLDLIKYLDVAPPRDERDFYMVLPQESKIKNDRVPFFSIFEATTDVKKMMGADLNAKDWALALAACDQSDQRSMLDAFSDRLRFVIQEEIATVDLSKIDNLKIRNIRKAIIQSFIRHNNASKVRTDSADETTGNKAA